MTTSPSPVLTPGARRILDTAARLFYRSGITAVGVDTIAAKSGFTKRTLYDRFGSKDALVVRYLQDRHDRWWARLEEYLAEAPAPRVLAFFDAYADGVPDADRGCAFLNAAGELPIGHPAHDVVRAHKDAVRNRLGDVLRMDGMDRPDGTHVERLADQVFLLLEGAVAHRGLPDGARLQSVARELARDLVSCT